MSALIAGSGEVIATGHDVRRLDAFATRTVHPLTANSHKQRWPMLSMVTIAVGIASGVGGMGLGLLLKVVQHITYGYSLHTIMGGESFLHGVSAASGLRRFVALCVCGLVAGIGWRLLYRF